MAGNITEIPENTPEGQLQRRINFLIQGYNAMSPEQQKMVDNRLTQVWGDPNGKEMIKRWNATDWGELHKKLTAYRKAHGLPDNSPQGNDFANISGLASNSLGNSSNGFLGNSNSGSRLFGDRTGVSNLALNFSGRRGALPMPPSQFGSNLDPSLFGDSGRGPFSGVNGLISNLFNTSSQASQQMSGLFGNGTNGLNSMLNGLGSGNLDLNSMIKQAVSGMQSMFGDLNPSSGSFSNSNPPIQTANQNGNIQGQPNNQNGANQNIAGQGNNQPMPGWMDQMKQQMMDMFRQQMQMQMMMMNMQNAFQAVQQRMQMVFQLVGGLMDAFSKMASSFGNVGNMLAKSADSQNGVGGSPGNNSNNA